MIEIKQYDDEAAKMAENRMYIPKVDSKELFDAYHRSRKRNLDAIDFDLPISDRNIDAISDAMKTHGITKFTISMHCSDDADMIAAFIERGWKLDGLTKVNARTLELDVYNDYDWTRTARMVDKPTNAFVLVR